MRHRVSGRDAAGKLRLSSLQTRTGLYASGLTAGIATGLAAVGGMVVALYILAQDKPARVIRGSLVLFLFASSIMSMIAHLSFGVMTGTAVWRGLAFALPTLVGVALGQRLFIPRYEPWYKPFCLTLLIGLAGWGILRLSVQ